MQVLFVAGLALPMAPARHFVAAYLGVNVFAAALATWSIVFVAVAWGLRNSDLASGGPGCRVSGIRGLGIPLPLPPGRTGLPAGLRERACHLAGTPTRRWSGSAGCAAESPASRSALKRPGRPAENLIREPRHTKRTRPHPLSGPCRAGGSREYGYETHRFRLGRPGLPAGRPDRAACRARSRHQPRRSPGQGARNALRQLPGRCSQRG